jgi:hypothetical protein
LDQKTKELLEKERKLYFDEQYNSYTEVNNTIEHSIKWDNPFCVEHDLIFEHDKRTKEKFKWLDGRASARDKKRAGKL